jgi:hypothetical protein
MFASAVLVAVVSVHRLGVAEDEKESGGLPPVVVDKSKPLLLEDPPQNKPQIKANNKACYVCHANYEEEPFAVVHGVADVGCADCHGKSPAHIDDENHLTPPDIMFPPDHGSPALAGAVRRREGLWEPRLHRLSRQASARKAHLHLGQTHSQAGGQEETLAKTALTIA